jgi:hypothetical protein
VQMYTADTCDIIRAHRWVKIHWDKVRALSSRKCSLPKSIPGASDSTEWLKCTRKVVREQMGVGIGKMKKKKNRSISFMLTTGSLWRTLGIDLSSYAQWLLSEDAVRYAVSACVSVPCMLCNYDGGPVECVFQGGMARCTRQPSQDCEEHRDVYKPLDVGLVTDSGAKCIASIEPMEDDAGEAVATLMDGSVAEDGEVKVDMVLVDKLLQFMGFPDGHRTIEPVRIGDILRAVKSNQPLSQSDQVQVKLKFKISLTHAESWDSARALTPTLLKLAAKTKFKVTSKLLQRKVAESRVFFIAS